MNISRKCLSILALAVGATFSQMSHLRANDIPAPTDNSTIRPTYLTADVPTTTEAANQPDKRLLMSVLDTTPVGNALEASRINVYGWVEASYQLDFSRPPGDVVFGRAFDYNQPHDFFLNELDLNIERKVDLSTHQFDIGGHVEGLFGTDAPQVHSSDLTGRGPTFQHSEYGFDLHQIYVDVGIPVGNGVLVRLGKFEFFRELNPDSSIFYTSTFAYSFAFPFTLTGGSVMYPISTEEGKQFSAELGVARGFNQSLTDNNGVPDYFGRINFDLSDQTNIRLSAITGAEENDDNRDNTTLFDMLVTNRITNDFAVFIDAMYGNQRGQPNVDGSRSSDNYYGVSGNAVYRINPTMLLAGRLEWYRDETGAAYSAAFPSSAPVLLGSLQMYEATVGLTISPFQGLPYGSNLKLRPEVRYDYSDKGVFSGGKHDQVSFAIDAVYHF